MKQLLDTMTQAIWRWFVPERPSFYDRGLLALICFISPNVI
jgi:cell division protein FtsW